MKKIITLIALTCLVLSMCQPVFALAEEQIQEKLDEMNKFLDQEPELPESKISSSRLVTDAKLLIDPDRKIPNYNYDVIRPNTANSLGLLGGPRGNGNRISWRRFRNGHIVLGSNGWCIWGHFNHAGIYDNYRETGHEYDAVFWSGWPRYGVTLQRKSHFHKYSKAVGLTVRYTSSSMKNNCIRYVRKLKRRPYSLFTNKRSNVYWC